jgi:hypothetical protein
MNEEHHDDNSEAPCALCGAVERLQQSHIIPRFVFQYLLDSSPGLLRASARPNRRIQDGPTMPLLCRACESSFGEHESAFARKLFLPLHVKNVQGLTYGPWALKFGASLVWRVARYMERQGRLDHLTPPQQALLREATGRWAGFLRGERVHPGSNEVHMYPLDALKSTTVEKTSPAINRYFLRGIDLDVIASPNTAVVYAKAMRLAFFGIVQARYGTPEWGGGKLRVKEGAVSTGTYRMPGEVGLYMNDKADKVLAAMNTLSVRQQAVLDELHTKDPQAIAESEAFRAMVADVEISGDAAFAAYGNEIAKG